MMEPESLEVFVNRSVSKQPDFAEVSSGQVAMPDVSITAEPDCRDVQSEMTGTQTFSDLIVRPEISQVDDTCHTPVCLDASQIHDYNDCNSHDFMPETIQTNSFNDKIACNHTFQRDDSNSHVRPSQTFLMDNPGNVVKESETILIENTSKEMESQTIIIDDSSNEVKESHKIIVDDSSNDERQSETLLINDSKNECITTKSFYAKESSNEVVCPETIQIGNSSGQIIITELSHTDQPGSTVFTPEIKIKNLSGQIIKSHFSQTVEPASLVYTSENQVENSDSQSIKPQPMHSDEPGSLVSTPPETAGADDAGLACVIAQKDREISDLQKLVSKYGELLEVTSKYNAALRQELSQLKAQLLSCQSRSCTRTSASTQVCELQITEACVDKPMPDWATDPSQLDGQNSIADIVRAAAEEECQNQLYETADNPSSASGQYTSDQTQEYVFDESSGLYYHPASGYYWEPNYGLFYDCTTGTYYKYDETSGTYEVHSQLDVAGENSTSQMNPDTHIIDSLSTQFLTLKIDAEKCQRNAREVAENYPPCIRLIVQSSDHLPLGSLSVITCAGGTLGKDKATQHAVDINDEAVSKMHAAICYDYDRGCYLIRDLGSQNGTFLNGFRLSTQSRLESSQFSIHHQDRLRLGSTTFLLHIHPGGQTCDDCEPGQVQARIKAANAAASDRVILSSEEKHMLRKKELKNIKKKYGLENMRYEVGWTGQSNPKYTDKAHLRRKTNGSEPASVNSHVSSASVHRPISELNKGHKLLAKLGWKEGQGLGKLNSGITEPVNVELRVNQSAGLGSSVGVSVSLDSVEEVGKTKRWVQARRRYDQLQGVASGQPLPEGGSETFPSS